MDERALTSFEDDGVELVTAPLVAEPEVIAASLALLSDAERERALRFVFDRDRRRFIMARSQLRRLLGARLGLRPDAIEFVYGPQGKPALAPDLGVSHVEFNLSHCRDLVVYAFAKGRTVGVDLEAIDPIPDGDLVAARFFSHKENEVYQGLEASQKPVGFFNCWTRKEAFIKASGDGLSHPLDQFDVSLVPGEPARILRVGATPGDRCGWEMTAFSPAPGFVAAMVRQTPLQA